MPTAPGWDRDNAIANLKVSEIPFDSTNGNCMGYARGRSFAISPLCPIPHKTLFHELAHIELGHTGMQVSDSESLTRNLCEVEAEATALILCESLGLSGAAECRGYIQNWLQTDSIPERSAQGIISAADRILKAGTAATIDVDVAA